MILQSSPLIWSTDVRSTRFYGQFLASPNLRNLILISNPDIRSARLYGQFSLDKTWTLQAGSTVLAQVAESTCLHLHSTLFIWLRNQILTYFASIWLILKVTILKFQSVPIQLKNNYSEHLKYVPLKAPLHKIQRTHLSLFEYGCLN